MLSMKYMFVFLFAYFKIVHSKYPCFKEDSVPSSDSYLPWEDVTLYLYTRDNPEIPTVIPYGDNTTLEASNFKPSRQTKILVHGRGGYLNDVFNNVTVNAVLYNYDDNVFVVEWKCGANGEYDHVVSLVPKAGEVAAAYLNWIYDCGVSQSNIQLIGFSQGGQMVGIIGRTTKFPVYHITSLDPAGPLWMPTFSNISISKNDGDFVEIIHTATSTRGMIENRAHCDFYPNKGYRQPGCLDEENACSHMRAVYLFAESLNTTSFTSFRCDDYENMLEERCNSSQTTTMGGNSPRLCDGIYFLKTNSQSPFSLFRRENT